MPKYGTFCTKISFRYFPVRDSTLIFILKVGPMTVTGTKARTNRIGYISILCHWDRCDNSPVCSRKAKEGNNRCHTTLFLHTQYVRKRGVFRHSPGQTELLNIDFCRFSPTYSPSLPSLNLFVLFLCLLQSYANFSGFSFARSFQCGCFLYEL